MPCVVVLHTVLTNLMPRYLVAGQTHGDVMTRMAAAATATAPQLLWPVIADQYCELVGQPITASVAA